MSFLEPANKTQLNFIKKDNVYRSDAELEEDVTQLIEWLSKQPHLPKVTDRKWLLHFITGCKFSLQRSKQVIEMYFMARTEFPEFFSPMTKQDFDICAALGRLCFFPKLTQEGYRISCVRSFPPANDAVFAAMPVLKWCLTMLQLQLKEEPMYGNIFMYDMKYFHLSHFLSATPTMVNNLFKCCVQSFPLRVKSAHFLNPPKFIGRFLMLIKMFLPNKIKQRLFVHNSIEELYQHIPKDLLPDIYGGTVGNIEKFEDFAFELFNKNIEWLENQPKADLSKLPEHAKSKELNMNGTFKQMQID